jgi:hypothetical protein
MSGVFYAHRLSKILDETVRDLGLTLTISDQGGRVELKTNIENYKMVAAQLGVTMKVEAVGDRTQITFRKA